MFNMAKLNMTKSGSFDLLKDKQLQLSLAMLNMAKPGFYQVDKKDIS